MIEAIMLVVLGFLVASLIGLAIVPALARRADRLARRRAEAAFPLSLAEIAADRDHLRAELALRERGMEQRADLGFAAKASAMGDIGRRDMTIGRLEQDRTERDHRIAGLEADLATMRDDLAQTREALSRETASLAQTAATLEGRIADLASVEQALAETRGSLTGTSADLERTQTELAERGETLERVQAALATRDQELAAAREQVDALRLSEIENRTRILALEVKREELSDTLSSESRMVVHLGGLLAAMTAERDAERLRGDAFDARAAQAEAGLAAADARSVAAAVEARQLADAVSQQRAVATSEAEAKVLLAQDLDDARRAFDGERQRLLSEVAGLKRGLTERDGTMETMHAEIRMLQGALAQARADRPAGKRQPDATAEGDAALRRQITALADQFLAQSAKREAAE